jgi:hypothetical protein
MLDTKMIGVAAAKAMAKLERDLPDGEGWEIADVAVIVEVNRPWEEPDADDETREDWPAVETRMLKVCTSPRWTVEEGMLRMALTTHEQQHDPDDD